VVSLLLYATVCAFFPGGRPLEHLPPERRLLGRATLAVLAIVLLQISLGAWLRGSLELAVRANPTLPRAAWLDHVGAVDALHEGFAQLVFLSVLALAVAVRRYFGESPWLVRAAGFCVLLVLIQLGTGLGLAGWAIPPVLQVIHLTTGSLLMGGLTVLALLAWRLPVEERSAAHHVHAEA
jgi:cytochrome c oxidase assembly protein subunit 15